jgi:hypothetical protein
VEIKINDLLLCQALCYTLNINYLLNSSPQLNKFGLIILLFIKKERENCRGIGICLSLSVVEFLYADKYILHSVF